MVDYAKFLRTVKDNDNNVLVFEKGKEYEIVKEDEERYFIDSKIIEYSNAEFNKETVEEECLFIIVKK